MQFWLSFISHSRSFTISCAEGPQHGCWNVVPATGRPAGRTPSSCEISVRDGQDVNQLSQMKPKLLLVATLAICCVGCGKTETVRVMSSAWNLGQHFDCLYDKQNIYCFPPSTKSIDRYSLEGWTDKSGKPMARTAILFGFGPDIIHYLERNREAIEKDKSAETGTYETHFSASPPDYSLWDCYRTGSGQPAIACQLTEKPDRADRDWETKKEEAAKLDDVLIHLVPESVIKRCGQPQKQTPDPSPTLFYPSTRPGISVKLWFADKELYSVETTDEKKPDGNYPPEFFIWIRNGNSLDAAPKVVNELSCLKQ